MTRGQAQPDPVLVEARQTLVDVQAALQQVFTAASGHGIRRARDVCSVFGVQTTLGWSLFRAATARDPFEAVPHLPGQSGMSIFLKAAEGRRLPEALIDQARSAFERFEQLVATHAGDRDMLEMMLADESPERFEQVERACRKAGFVANSFLTGVQARVKLACTLYRASGDDVVDICWLSSTLDLRRLRPGVSWGVTMSTLRHDSGDAVEGSSRPVGDPVGDRLEQLGMLREFSSTPLPEIRQVPVQGGVVAELVGWPAGMQGAATITTASFRQGCMQRYRCERNQESRISTKLRTPCELLIKDHLIARSAFGPVRPELQVFNQLHILSEVGRQPIRVSEQARHLGRGEHALALMEMPRYPEMVRWVCGRLGWDPEEFDVYRARMEHPPIPTSIDLVYPLPERPA